MLSEPGRMNRPWIRLSTNFTAGEAAMHIIERVDNGYWFAGEFRTDQILLDGANDFATVEAFGKWQQWYAQECARTGLLGYEVVSSWYSLQFTGVDMIMTAIDAQQNGLNWTHALNVLEALPFLSKLNIPVTIKDSVGNVVGKVSKSRSGKILFEKAGNAIVRLQDYFPNAILRSTSDSLIPQVTDNRCGETCLQMIFSDWDIPVGAWPELMKNGLDSGGQSIDEMYSIMKNSNAGFVDSVKMWGGATTASQVLQSGKWLSGKLSVKDLIKLSNSHPVIAQVHIGGATGNHWVIVDGTELINGKEYFKIRDPGCGEAYSLEFLEFIDAWRSADERALTF